MNTSSRLALATLCAAMLGSACALLPGAAQARERHTTLTGANGQTATRHVTRSQGNVQSGTTLPSGKTSSRSVERSASGTTATVTGPNGRTATRTTTVTR